jgi:hypothetical protein
MFMEHKLDLQFYFPELWEAILNGFSHSFRLCPLRGFICDSSPPRSYEPSELIVQIKFIEWMNCILYLITCPDGTKGTLTEFID